MELLTSENGMRFGGGIAKETLMFLKLSFVSR